MMITEPTAAPPEVLDTIEKLRVEVEKLQRELAQGVGVWQGALAEEKKQFEEFLQHKELAWREQEDQWIRQGQAYEARLAEQASEFESRLKQTEQNAARALADLDDAWQREKLEWGRAAERPAAGPTPSTVKALQEQLLQFQQTVASLQDRAAQSGELVNACVLALDYQITVLYDLIHHYAAPVSAPGDGPPSNLAQS